MKVAGAELIKFWEEWPLEKDWCVEHEEFKAWAREHGLKIK